MNNTILPEDSQNNQPRIVSRELNLDFGQFFYPQERRKIFEIRQFRSELTDEQGNKQIISAVTHPHPLLGTLTTFDERTFYALVELWYEQGKPHRTYFSERELIRRLAICFGSNTERAIRESLERLRGVLIRWEDSFYLASEKQYQRFNPFSLLNHLDIVSNHKRAINKWESTFGFDDRVIENLNNNYLRPIRFDAVLSFRSPLAQAIYILLDRKLYGTKNYHRTTAGLLLDDLRLIGLSYERRSKRVQVISRVRDELIGVPLSYGEVIEIFEIDTSKKGDAIVRVTRSGGERIKGRKVEIPKDPQAEKSSSPKNRRKASSKAQGGANHTPDPQKPVTGSREALEVLQYFTKTFNNQEHGKFSPNDVSKAQEVITKHGMERAKFFIQFAHREATQTNYKPKHIQGIIKYLDAALAEYERLQRIAKRGEDEAARRRLENARYDHERTYESDYHQYIDEMLSEIGDRHLEKFKEFRQWQAKERKNIVESTTPDGIKEIQLRTFDSDGSRILRLGHFFKDDSDLNIPDFWEWDAQHNPNSFGR